MKQTTKEYLLKRLYGDLYLKTGIIIQKENFLDKHRKYKDHEKIFNETFENYEISAMEYINKINAECENLKEMIIEIERIEINND